MGSNGTSATNPGGSMSNFYCTTGTTYTGYYYSSGYKTSTTGRVAASTLKGYASTLGSAFVTDSNNINNGYPILTWQTKISE